MKAWFSITAVLLLSLGALAWLWYSPAGFIQAPSVHLRTIEGESISLQALQGAPVLVYFWATNCPSCIKEMPDLLDLYRDYASRGLHIIGITMSHDPPDQVIQLLKHRAMPYSIVLDVDGRLARAFGDVRFTPTHFLIAPNGRIARYTIGEEKFSALRAQIEAMLDVPDTGGQYNEAG